MLTMKIFMEIFVCKTHNTNKLAFSVFIIKKIKKYVYAYWLPAKSSYDSCFKIKYSNATVFFFFKSVTIFSCHLSRACHKVNIEKNIHNNILLYFISEREERKPFQRAYLLYKENASVGRLTVYPKVQSVWKNNLYTRVYFSFSSKSQSSK